MDSEQRAKLWLGKLTKLNPNQANPRSVCRGKAYRFPTLNFKLQTSNRRHSRRMFDEGLWSVDDNLRIVVNTKKFKEHGPEVVRLNSFAGRNLQFDPAAKLRPRVDFLKQHRIIHVTKGSQLQ